MLTLSKNLIDLIKDRKKDFFNRYTYQILYSISNKAVKLLQADRATIYIYDKMKEELYSFIALNLEISEIRLKIGEGIAGKTALLKKGYIVNDTEKSPDFNPYYDSQTNYKTKTLITAPLLNDENQLIGVIQVLNKKDNEFTLCDMEMLENLASISAITIEQVQITIENQILKEYNRILMSNFDTAVCVLDNDWVIQDFNSIFLTMIKKNIDISNKKLSEVAPFLSKILNENNTISVETNLFDRFYHIKISNIVMESEDKPIGKILIATDITEKIEERADKELKERLSLLGRMNSQILHDIKNPLFVIKGYTKLLSSSEDPEDKKRYILTIENEANRILEIAQELLDFSRGTLEIIPKKISLASFQEHLSGFIAKIQETFEVSIEKKFCSPESYFMNVDLSRMDRVFHNLILNAIEAIGQEEEKIEVETRIENNFLLILFKDNGIGIPEEIKKTLFKPFVSRNKEKGTGLGLAIAEMIVKRHNGTIDVQNDSSWKTVFCVQLPIYQL